MKCGQNVGVDTERIVVCNARSIDYNEYKFRYITEVCKIILQHFGNFWKFPLVFDHVTLINKLTDTGTVSEYSNRLRAVNLTTVRV